VSGQIFSILGVWMQGTAVSWLVWRLTESPRWLGAIGFATQIPILILGLYAGVVADRVSRYRLVILIQGAAMVQAAVLAILTATDLISAPIVFSLSLLLGVVFAFDFPSRQSFLMDMVGHEDIGNAIAINSTTVHTARVLGPVAAGFVIAEFGEEACFAVNAASFLFVLTALFLMRRSELFPQEYAKKISVRESIFEGLRFVSQNKTIKRPLFLMLILSLVAMPYVFFLPQIANERFGGGARYLGIMMSMAGFGSLSGAIFLAAKKKTDGFYPMILVSLGICGAGLMGVGLIKNFAFVLFSIYVVSCSSFLVVIGTQTVMQVGSPPSLRGRLMSVFTVTFFGFAPIGSFIAGQVAAFIGVGSVLAIGGTICIATAICTKLINRNK